MRSLIAGLLALLVLTPPAAASLRTQDTLSTDALLRWIDGYRKAPDPKAVPDAMRALSRLGAFNRPDSAGVYVGFLAGVIASNPDRAERLIDKSLGMRTQDHWAIVRAIAYSGSPRWKKLLRKFADRIPARQAMIEKYTDGKLPTLNELEIEPNPSTYSRLQRKMFGKPSKKVRLEPSADVLDTLWGFYFATGSYGPVMRIIELLPWSEDRDDVERLSLGNMAKYTLANNAVRDQTLLTMLRSSAKARGQPERTVALLKEVVEAAEMVDTASIRQEATASIDELRRKGPAYKRNVSWWGYVGQTALAGGCLAAAAAGQIALGLPCVVGGAASSAALNFWNNQP